MNVRALAAGVLLDAERAFVDKALAQTERIPPRDRAFLTELVYGATRRRLSLDYILGRLAKKKRIPPRLRAHLRVALYEIRHMRTPNHAAVNEAVELCRAVSRKSASFANALLRRAIDQPPAFPKRPPARRLSVTHSHPEWLVARWIKQHGADRAEKICEAGNAALPVTAWIRKTGEIVIVTGDPAEYSDPIQVQDRTQGKAAPLLAPKPGERILDLCAAPGTKALHIAHHMKNQGEILAVDISAERLHLLEQADCPIIRCRVDDGRKITDSGFDAALVDAPCSNTAVLARRADARWRLRPKDIETLPKLQHELLESAFRAVRPGGRIAYVTCSLEREENDDVVQTFCRQTEGAELRKVELVYPTDRAAGGFFALIARA